MKKQNETLYYNKELLLDQLSLQSIQLQLQTTADVHYTNTSQLAQVPVIKKLNLDNNVLAEFSNNALPDIQSVSLASNDLVSFDGNTLPVLNQLNVNPRQGQELKLKSISGNYLGQLSELPDLRGSTLATFSRNNIPLLKRLDLSSSNLTTFEDNKLPALTTLDLSSTFLSIFQGYSLAKLASIDLSNCGLVRFDDNVFPVLQSLSINNNLLRTLGKSQLPLLSYLSVTQNSFSTLIDLLQYPVLDTVIVEKNRVAAVENITKDTITYLALTDNAALASFKNNTFQKLKELSINGCSLLTEAAFVDNTLPVLTHIDAAKTGFTSFTDQLGAQFAKLESIILGGSPIQ